MLSQQIQLKKHIEIGDKSSYLSDFSGHGINFIDNLFDTNGKYKSWDTIMDEHNLTNKETF